MRVVGCNAKGGLGAVLTVFLQTTDPRYTSRSTKPKPIASGQENGFLSDSEWMEAAYTERRAAPPAGFVKDVRYPYPTESVLKAPTAWATAGPSIRLQPILVAWSLPEVAAMS